MGWKSDMKGKNKMVILKGDIKGSGKKNFTGENKIKMFGWMSCYFR